MYFEKDSSYSKTSLVKDEKKCLVTIVDYKLILFIDYSLILASSLIALCHWTSFEWIHAEYGVRTAVTFLNCLNNN